MWNWLVQMGKEQFIKTLHGCVWWHEIIFGTLHSFISHINTWKEANLILMAETKPIEKTGGISNSYYLSTNFISDRASFLILFLRNLLAMKSDIISLSLGDHSRPICTIADDGDS